MTEPMKIKAYPDVTLLFVPERKGKTAAMNRGMGFVTTPLVIFTDANTFINPQAVREMVKYFNHPQVGCVAGENGWTCTVPKERFPEEKDCTGNMNHG